MRKARKKVATLLAMALFCALLSPGLFGGVVAWAFEATVVETSVYEDAVDAEVYADAVDAEVYADAVDEIVYDVDAVEDVVYEVETVEDAVYSTVEGSVYFTGLGEDVFALIIDDKVASVFGELKENDVEPIIRNDRTMLPARFVAENLGASVAWYGDERMVTVISETVEIKLVIDSDVAIVNGVEEKLDSPAFIENDRTYTPVRFIAEKLGATVDWDGSTRMVTIVKNA